MAASHKQKTFSHFNRYVALSIGVILAVLWSWMLRLHIMDLTGSFFVGYLLALLGFVTVVALSWFVFWRTVRHFITEYVASDQLSYWFLVKLLVVWAAVEYMVSWLVAVVWMGQGGSLDTVLPFGSFAALLAYTPFGLLARFVGFHGVSALFVIIIATLVFKKLQRFALPILLLAGALTVASWLMYRHPDGHVAKAQIISNRPSDPVALAQPDSELVVYSEYGLSELPDTYIASLLKDSKVPETFYLGSRYAKASTGVQNQLVFGSNQQGTFAIRPKSRLIPAGEYIPYAAEYILKATNSRGMIAEFKNTRELQPGPAQINPITLKDGLVVGSGVCASIISPEDYRRMTSHGATLLTNSASLGIFDSTVFDVQHLGLAKFMAMANARPFLQSSTDGAAFALDHNGKTLHKIRPGEAVATVQTNAKKTPYTYLGEWVAYAGLLVLAYGCFQRARKFFYNTAHEHSGKNHADRD